MSTDSCSLAIVGDGAVGKSTIINAFRTDGFVPVYKQTIGCDFYERQLQIRSDYLVSLRVWDIGGQSIQSKNLESYINSANAIMLVYDVTNSESFGNLDDWLSQIHKNAKTKFIYLVGNKVDLISIRQISERQHDSFIISNDLKGGLFCSAKTGENVVKSFYKIAGEVIGLKLTEFELAYHDKVLTASVEVSNDKNEKKNAWASDIEREDAELERRKAAGADNKCTCVCS